MKCAFCKKKIKVDEKIARKDICPHCGEDLRCCVQCGFYEPHAYNECKEVMAERVSDKERANFCEYFVVGGKSKKRVSKKQNARDALEALFKK